MIHIDVTMKAANIKKLLGSTKPVLEKSVPANVQEIPESLHEEAAANGMTIKEYIEYLNRSN